ncbi:MULTISPECIES: phosphoglycolate phosphatase [Ramlibacter]|uniref:Phosphoglycolate phosphatase n=1 Tax=Ramlibacter pinisoli TaxID=2682844 RepID=A0A6N8IUZ0_9BURK|nr:MULTISPECIES: phosphoglycolate phosphatase [Ramlibacter]MBA2965691.1 phosphoglycolate phosphatase [Ramlibacter sp. CGMCC 1.13660]MVQ30657.1 phosphoglycolate phosphatase [Ramlibacter pinisoli]
MPALTAAIIDLDGTLVDTLGDFSAALAAVHRDLGLPVLPTEAVGLLVGKGSEHLIRSALRAVGADEDRYAAAWDAYQHHYGTLNGRAARVYPGVAEGLRALRSAGLRLACVTNKPAGFARVLLEAKGLAGAFDVVYGGDSFERKKPDPLPLLRACEALASRPAATLVVGDSSNDAAAARAAGCPVVLVTYGYNHGQPVRNVPADGYLETLADLARWV